MKELGSEPLPSTRFKASTCARTAQVTQAYNVFDIPRYYLVDPQGLIVEDRLRVFDVGKVVAKIEENL